LSSAASAASIATSPDLAATSPATKRAPVDGSDAANRGKTRINPAVVEKVAAQAVHEIDHATGSTRRVLGITLGATDQDTRARVSAQVDDDTATIAITMTVIYPTSVQHVTRQTRQHVRERVRDLVGITVQEVDITVSGMRSARPDIPRVR
jgi:uncharacterized alkaline shock family protein YloU